MNPTGKGMFIWRLLVCAEGKPLKLAEMAQDLGLSWVAIKAVDGIVSFNQGVPGVDWAGPNLLPAAVAALEAVGIRIWLWGYVYGTNRWGQSIVAKEAEKAVENISRFHPDGWIIDAEGEFKKAGSGARADQYMTILRATYPRLPIGLCSYRFPSYHPEFCWHNFLRYCDFHLPQVYWVGAHNPGDQLGRSVRELKALADLPVVPAGPAYYEPGLKWQPTLSEVNELDRVAHQLNLPGITWWEWGENGHGTEYLPDLWEAIKGHQWGTPAIPPLAWDHAITGWARTLGYVGPDPE